MSKILKIFLIAVSGIISLLVLGAVVLLLFVDANAHKPRLEAAASKALGMEVRVGGRLGVGFFPGLLVTLEDVRIRNREADIVSATEAWLWIDILPLLRQEIRIGKIALKQPIITIERDPKGHFNFENPEPSGGTLPVLNLAKISLVGGRLHYADKQSGGGFEAGDCSLNVDRLRLAGGRSADFMKNLSIKAELSCGEIRKNDFTLSGVKLSVSGKGGVFDLKLVTMHAFGGQGTGSVQADYSGTVPRYQVRYSLLQFNIGEFFKVLSPQHVAQGPMDFTVALSMQGSTAHDMRQSAEGELSLRGEHLVLDGNDIDDKIARFKSSQNFNIVDVGAFFFAGPAGLAITKGYNFVSIFQGSGGRSDIRTFFSSWKVEHGVAQAQDVALATHRNRIALQGGIDFVNERFNGVTVAVIDARGCATVRQKIRGSFRKPQIEQPKILRSLTGPAITLLKKGRDLFPGGKCEVFYAGSVAPPK